jgi:hypothetical protein
VLDNRDIVETAVVDNLVVERVAADMVVAGKEAAVRMILQAVVGMVAVP